MQVDIRSTIFFYSILYNNVVIKSFIGVSLSEYTYVNLFLVKSIKHRITHRSVCQKYTRSVIYFCKINQENPFDAYNKGKRTVYYCWRDIAAPRVNKCDALYSFSSERNFFSKRYQ